MEFLYWTLCYAIPAGVAACFLKSQQISARNRIVTIHGFLLLSIFLLSGVMDVSLDWNLQTSQLLLIGAGILLSVYILGFAGLLYAISSAIQEYCLLLAGVLIVPRSGLLLGAMVTSLPYALAHFGNRAAKPDWQWKFPLLFLWGTASILLYFLLQQPLLNIILHTGIGAILIRAGVLYQSSKISKNR